MDSWLLKICDMDRDRLLGKWTGYPADRVGLVLVLLGVESFLGYKIPANPEEEAKALGHFRLHRVRIQRGRQHTFVEIREAQLYAEQFLLPDRMLNECLEFGRVSGARRKLVELSPVQIAGSVAEISRIFGCSPRLVESKLVRTGMIEKFETGFRIPVPDPKDHSLTVPRIAVCP